MTTLCVIMGIIGVFLGLCIIIFSGILEQLTAIRYSLARLDNLSYAIWEKLQLGK